MLAADAVIELLRDGAPALAVILEVQLRADARKRASWPVYVSFQARSSRCPAMLVVVTPSVSVARWASKRIVVGPGFAMDPMVVGPAEIPRVEVRGRSPASVELAVLSAIAHGNEVDGLETVVTAFEALASVERARALCYAGVIYQVLGEATRRALEERMETSKEILEATKLFRRRMAERFYASGRREGEAHGEARALLRVLDARGFALSDAARVRIEESGDVAQIEAWIARAVTAATLDEVFANGA